MWLLALACRPPRADDSAAPPSPTFGETLAQVPVLDAIQVALADGMAYVCVGERGLDVFDLHDPTRPEWVRTEDLGGPCLAMEHYGQRLWVALGDAGFKILDIDPFFVAGAYAPGGRVVDVAVSPQLDWLTLAIDTGHGARFLSFDVELADFKEPVADQTTSGPAPAALAEIQESYAAILDDGTVRLLGTVLDTQAELPGAALGGGRADLAIQDDLVWALLGEGGLHGIRITDPGSPTDLGALDLGTLAPTSVTTDDAVLVIAARGGLGLYDVGDDFRPVLRGSWVDLPSLERPSHIALDQDLAVLADPVAEQLSVVFLGTPAEPLSRQ